jgi:hypothetical protein
MVRACSMHGEMRSRYKILAGKPEGKRPLGRPTYKSRITNVVTA